MKDELKFEGFVVTDWQNVSHLIHEQHLAENERVASRIALESGNDMMMNAPEFYENMISLVKSGEVDETLIDEAVMRILNVKERFGLLDDPFKQSDEHYLGCEEHLRLAEEIAEESVVLLKNDGVLPLGKKHKNILVVGQSADDIRCQYGDWTYFTHPLSDYEQPPHRSYCTLLEGVQELGKQFGCHVVYEKGCDIESDDESGFADAVKAAEECDLIIFACGDNPHLAAEGRDRADVKLTESQKKLFTELCRMGKPIVSVLIATKPLCIPEIDHSSNAVLTFFNGGMFGGRALGKVIFGELNPSGKLPISFPYHVGQQPVYYNQLPGWHASSYVDMPSKPLYPFGKGLSYTSFAYSQLQFDGKKLKLKVTVTNTGARDGKEVVQIYFRDIVSSVITPVKRLISFRKIALAAGESKTLEFDFTRNDFSFVNAREERVTEAGTFEIMAGGSSDDIDLLKTTFIL